MDAIVIGDGPGGLSAALFLAKSGLEVSVYGQDKTAMHWALLKNYLGLPEVHGSEFQKVARKQVEALLHLLSEDLKHRFPRAA
jgi:thioredoxin reductase (NADPH)